MSTKAQDNHLPGNMLTRGAFWTSLLFYALIAFEFFYMFSPFAMYFYGVYNPGLSLIRLSENTSWLTGFFMPHIARETKSFFISFHEAFGIFLFLSGLIAFTLGALQIYTGKIRKQKEVTSGVYRNIRHPQYLALMVASVGMVLIWPRYLVLFGCITVCFAYWMLAKTEEKICLRKYPGYKEYLRKTGMFLPSPIERSFPKLPKNTGTSVRVAVGVVLYMLLLTVSFYVARQLHTISIRSLYTHHIFDMVYLSPGKMTPETFSRVHSITANHAGIQEMLGSFDEDSRFIAYTMPIGLYISEIPMHLPPGVIPTHRSPSALDQQRIKIVFTKAVFGPGIIPHGLNIIQKAIHKTPVLEAHIDMHSQEIFKLLSGPFKDHYAGIPVPLF
jgi:protein-S-isoprenylcysteine O-methyltransferase Ste14